MAKRKMVTVQVIEDGKLVEKRVPDEGDLTLDPEGTSHGILHRGGYVLPDTIPGEKVAPDEAQVIALQKAHRG